MQRESATFRVWGALLSFLVAGAVLPIPAALADTLTLGGTNGWQAQISGSTCDFGDAGCTGGVNFNQFYSPTLYGLRAGYVDDHTFTTGAYAEATVASDAAQFQTKLYVNDIGKVLAYGNANVNNHFSLSNLSQGNDGLYHVALQVWFDGTFVPRTTDPAGGAVQFHFDVQNDPCRLASETQLNSADTAPLGATTIQVNMPVNPKPYSQVYTLDCAFISANPTFFATMWLGADNILEGTVNFADTAGLYFDLPHGATVTDATGTFANAPIPSQVPEPASLVLLGSGLLTAGAFRRRRG